MKAKFRLFRQATALLTAASLVVSGPVAAASTDLADVPMAVKNTVLPNIMFTLDDSGSMHFEAMPDSLRFGINDVFPGAVFMFPRASSVYGDNDYNNNVVAFEDFDATNIFARYSRSSNNKLYYNPAIRYMPWSNADGSLMANADPTAAYHNPADTSKGSRNLTVANTQSARWLKNDGTLAQGYADATFTSSTSKTFYPAQYYIYNGGGPWNTSNYTRVEIKSVNAPFPKAAGRTDCAGTTCTYAEEIQNFANWYSYYRSSVLLARAGIGKAFAQQGTGMRVGFGAINKGSTSIDGVNTSTIIKGVRKFDGTDRTAFFSTLYGHTIPDAGTPLRKAMDDVGQYFSRTDDRGPWGETPGSTGGTQFSCRQNYHILMTDGYWSTGTGTTASTSDARGNNDGTNGPDTLNNDTTPPNPLPANWVSSYTYSATNPYTDSYSNTLADVAMYYWKKDLRTDLPNNVPVNAKDPAFWQHMVNFTVGLGVTGTLSSATIASAFTSSPQTITWPDPTSSEDKKVDDLAHAAVNSRGGFFSAADPTVFANALADALQDIASRNGAAAAVAVANANLVSGDSASYASGYNSGDWTGELSAYTLDPATGIPSTTANWTAQSQLDAVAASARKIATYTGTSGTSQGIQFQPTTAGTATKLSTAQQTLLNTPSQTDGANVVAWLRGDRTLEGGTYRTRTHVLGDVINAEPVIVREPRANYTDTDYATFKSSYASRTKVVYQGANDGMMHAFKADNPSGGSELWAYVPNLLMSTLNNLSRKTGFAHRYYVDGTPAAGDVDFKNTHGATGSGTDWRTILVGGLGKGGRGYFALDVTDPSAANEAAVAAKVLWEFPNSATSTTDKNNMGYSFGKPIIVKTASRGWVALVTSGYNNGTDSGGDGQGYLFVLNARTGEVIKAIATGVGSAADPSGLAYISAYVENSDIDNTVDFVYGGDLKGNVWRFDLTASNPNSWNVKKIATLVDASGNYQPITVTPELAKISYGGAFKRLIYVGTGLYFGDSDVPGTVGANSHATQTQTMYVLVDDTSSTPTITPLRSNLVQQTVTTGGVFTTSQVDYSTKKGWYIDLPTSGERINTDPAIGLTTLVFTTNVPNSNPCTPGGTSYLYAMDYAYEQGRSTPYVTASRTALGDGLGSRPVLVKTTTGQLKALVRKSDASTVTSTIPTTGGTGTTKRVSWRELPEQ